MCPKLKRDEVNIVQAAKPKAKGKMFTMSIAEIEGNEDLIQDTCCFNEISLFVMFDSGATHSLISNDVVNRLELPIVSLPYDLIVSTPTNEPFIVSTICSQCPIILDNRPVIEDLIYLSLSQFDIILGMNWLSNNHLSDPKNPTESYYETKSITANQIKKLLKDEAQVFVLLTSLEKKVRDEIQSLPIVRDFSAVFSDNILGLPLVREIDFAIDMVLGTGTITIAPYRMAPLELRELKKKLEYLL
ncbi:PREDICTED: uncharacterized protein LOC109352932 [Lupinus angustifolius]|uniref:uncharacterized protein LOC109352932 n=1 Tax=Lupinus angustifolius TaxID=3871 RepID=UPI00092F7AFB|nr:PREDICTED: uncharacterized protein LOC109352932 [Lupinus angustifolius]